MKKYYTKLLLLTILCCFNIAASAAGYIPDNPNAYIPEAPPPDTVVDDSPDTDIKLPNSPQISHKIFNGPWFMRIHGTWMLPDDSSTEITTLQGHATADNDFIPELELGYYLNPHWDVELILGTSRHAITAVNTVLTPSTFSLGRVSVLPPCLSIVWHPLGQNKIDPYLGAGVNYTIFYNETPGPVASSTHFRNSFGPVAQAGLNIFFNDHWFVNADIKKVYVKTFFTATAPGVTTAIQTYVTLHPWVPSVGIGYRA